MYSGTTFTNKSGSILGAHQKVDRSAYKYLTKIVPSIELFPKIKDILYFEGKNGPDGIKSKSPARDEPWHFYDPFDEEDTQLLVQLRVHYNELVKQLKKSEPERAAFDASWLAHGIVDGLTPAHHFPYEEKLAELRGEDLSERNSIRKKLVIPGYTRRDTLKKNWAMWGVGGLMSMHGLFEVGVAMLLAPTSLKSGRPSEGEIEFCISIGWEEYFKRAAREIALLDMYDRFHERGWSPKLIRDVRNHLGPTLVRAVVLVWYCAMRDAGLLRTKR